MHQAANSTKMSIMNFNSTGLVHEMLESEPMLAPAKTALRYIGSQLQMHSRSADGKMVTFRMNHRSCEEKNDCSYLTLRVIKGSLHTLIWSTFARFDDEYVLYYHVNEHDLRDNVDKVFLVWNMKGVDAVNSKISMGLIDWFLLRRIQASLKVNTVGVLAFSKMLGRFLLSAPNFLQMQRYMPPMPATFMFNYLMVVSYCPFELSVSKLQRFFTQGFEHTSGITNRALLQTFIQPNGSGAWINGYLPVRLASGGYALQSKYYFEQGDVLVMSSGYHAIVPTTNTTESATAVDVEAKGKDTGENNISGQPSGNTRSKSADSAHADHGQDLHANLHTVSMDCGDDASASTSPLLSPQQPPQHREAPALAPPPTQVFPHQQQGLASLTFSMQCDLLLQETAVRVVELLHHPLGVRGIIVVLEFVHNRMWTANSRFVALDAYKVCQAIHTAGQMPPMVLSKLSILDSEGWARLTSTAPGSGIFGTGPSATAAESEHQPTSAASAATGSAHTQGLNSVPSSESRDSIEVGPSAGPGLAAGEAADDTSDSGDEPWQLEQPQMDSPAQPKKSAPAPTATPLSPAFTAGTATHQQQKPQRRAPKRGRMMTVNFGQGKQQQQQQQQQAAGRYNFIDFENSCEWGAPNSIRKPPDFYSELIRELQDYSEKAMKDA